MKNKIYLYIILLFGFTINTSLEGQSIDMDKMNKDLEVAENVLLSLLEQSSKNRFLWRYGDNIESAYKNGYGVVFQIHDNFPRSLYGKAVVIGQKNNSFSVAKTESEDKNRAILIETDDQGTNTVLDIEAKIKENLNSFLMDYHHLIRQLKRDEHILIKTGQSRRKDDIFLAYTVTGRKRGNNHFSLEANVGDLQDFAKGALSKEEMLNKIVEKDLSEIGKDEPELQIFSAALGRMYQSDLASSYYLTNYPWFERMDGFGVNFYLKFYSSVIIENRYNLPTFKKDNLTLEERNEVIKEAYPSFKAELIENMLDYGHLLNNLDAEENVVFNVVLTECKGCGIPSEMELQVKKSVIDQYRNGSISLENAKKKVEVKIIK